MEESFLQDDETLAGLLAGFEAGTWPIADWRHAHHLAVAACYILSYGDALDRLRAAIPRYNVAQGGQNTPDSGYHETLTVFWYELIRHFVDGLQAEFPAGLTRLEATRRVVTEFAPQRDLFRRYYDFDVVKSREARAKWIPPSRPFAPCIQPA